MPNLYCSVANCNFNSSGYCALSSIDVSGGGEEKNTCCANFSDKTALSNFCCSNADSSTDVCCKAKDCVFNSNCKCSADSIDICSCGEACKCTDTECGSYKCKN